MTSIALKGLKKKYGSKHAVRATDMEIASGEFIVFVGPSGCGKSTLLRMISGLEEVTDGRILFDQVDVTARPASKRGVAMVFQAYALYPHMTAAQNLSFGLRMTGHSAEEIARRVERAVKILRLDDYLNRKPAQLSGGQCQRVAIGRALVQQPRVFLFDEPLSNLDAELRGSMRVEIAALHRELDNTMVYVTHDQLEAMTLADRIVVLNDGRIEQVGTPLEIYHEPKNIFVAEFMGAPRMNILPGIVVEDGGLFLLLDSNQKIPLAGGPGAVDVGDRVSVGVRPEHVASSRASALEMRVDFVEQTGAMTHYFGRIGGHEFRMASSEERQCRPGERICVGFAAERLHYFDAQGQRIGAEARR